MPQDIKHKLIKDAGIYSLSTYISEAMVFIRGVFVAKLLGPTNYGFWNALSLILEYGSRSHLGSLNALNKEIPFHRGRGDSEKVKKIRNVVFGIVVVVPILASLVIYAVSVLNSGKYSWLMTTGLRFIAVLLIFQQLYAYYRFVLISDNDFELLSKSQIVFSLLSLIVTPLLILKYQFTGLLLALSLSYLLVLIYMYRDITYTKDLNIKLLFDLKETLSLLKIGFPILTVGLVFGLLFSVDRLMILYFLGKTELGYYGIALMVSNFVYLFPGVISQIIYPRLSESFGVQNQELSGLKKFILVPTTLLAYLMPVIIGVIYLIMPLAIRIVLPKYIPGINAARISILGMFFFSLAGIPSSFLFAVNKWLPNLIITLFSLVINCILDFIFIKMGKGIEGVAFAGAALTYFIYSTIMFLYVLRHYTKNNRESIGFLFKIYFPIFYACLVLLVINSIVLSGHPSFFNNISLLSLQVLIFAIFSLPLLWYVNKETAIFSRVYAIFSRA